MSGRLALAFLLAIAAHAKPHGASDFDAIDQADQNLTRISQAAAQPHLPPAQKQDLQKQASQQMDKLDEIGAQRPLDPQAQQKITLVFMRHQAPARALTSADRLVKLKPQDASARVLHGNVYYAMQDFAKAHADAKRALELDPNNKQAQILFALTRNRADRPLPGAPGASAAGVAGAGPGGDSGGGAGSSPGSGAPPARAIASAYMAPPSPASGPSAEQLATQKQAVQTAERLKSESFVREAMAREALGDHDAAKAALEKALAADPKNPDALAGRATVRARAGDSAGAVADADAALALDARNAQALLARGHAKELANASPQEVLADYKAAADIDPELAPELNAALARASAREGRSLTEPLTRTNAPDVLFGRLPEPIQKHWPLGIMGLTIAFIAGSIYWLGRRG